MITPIERRQRVRWHSPDGIRTGRATDAQIAGEACMRCARGVNELVEAGTVQVGMDHHVARVCKGGCGALL